MNALTAVMTRLSKNGGRLGSNEDPVRKAVEWAKEAHKIDRGGNPLPSTILPPTKETTGYMIATLHAYGEKDFAIELAQWEASCQNPDGSFSAVDGVPYTFDTAMVIRGFLAVLDDCPALEPNLLRACEYVCSQIAPDGEVLTPSYDTWKLHDGSMLSEYGNLYILPPLLATGKKLSEPKYVEAARRGMEYFRRKPDLVEFKSELGTLSHYFGYMMEALVDLGEVHLARTGLKQARCIQRKDGSIPAYPGVNWVCSTGMAQLSIAWYKLGEREPADKAMDYLVRVQNRSGGFYGSYGRHAEYFPDKEISWAVKFFLDASLLRSKLEKEQGQS